MKINAGFSPIDRRTIHNPIARFRIWIGAAVSQNPLWHGVNWFATPLAFPFKALAQYSLVKIPGLEKVERVLEIRSLADRSPVLITLSMALCIFRGLKITNCGHIGTDRAIYPLIALISSFNPFLAICCAILFGIADLVQKIFLVNDIYGAPNRGSLDFVGALLGYCVAYSALVMMGIAPGVVSRLARCGIVRLLCKVSSADGASVKSHIPSLTEDLFAVAASTVTAVYTMRDLTPSLEMPAFYTRPHADASCFQMEVGQLQATAPFVGLSSALGTALAPTVTERQAILTNEENSSGYEGPSVSGSNNSIVREGVPFTPPNITISVPGESISENPHPDYGSLPTESELEEQRNIQLDKAAGKHVTGTGQEVYDLPEEQEAD